MRLKHKDIWVGNHEGVIFEVVRWHWDDATESIIGNAHPTGNWNYYIFIHEDSIPPEFRDALILKGNWDSEFSSPRWTYGYMGSLVGSLEWHGGITLYELEYHNGPDAPCCDKAGCEYMHCFDEGHHYNETCVERDAIVTINELLIKVPLLRRCGYDGVYRDRTKGKLHGESWVSDEGDALRVAKELSDIGAN